MTTKKRVAQAFQGGGFLAGAVGAGVVRYPVEKGDFDYQDIDVFSGTSAGALVASVCWGQSLNGSIHAAPEVLEKQWMHFANSLVPTTDHWPVGAFRWTSGCVREKNDGSSADANRQ